MYKKILSFWLILCMLCGMMPVSAFAAQPDGAAQNAAEQFYSGGTTDGEARAIALMSADSGEVSRIEWLGGLTETFEMTVEEDNYPDNYYSDINASSEHYRTAMLATEFGLVDVEAGDALRPEEPATREFAVHTLNLCLGFQKESAEYTFAESGSVTYPDDIQTAIDKQWFTLSDGKFLPENALTTAEKDSLLAMAKKVRASTDLEEDHKNQWELADGVIDLTGSVQAQMTDEDEFTLENCEAELKTGDIYAVLVDGFPVVRKVESLTKEGTTCVVQTQKVEYSDAYKSLDIQGSGQSDLTQTILCRPDLKMEYIVGGTLEQDWEDGAAYDSLSDLGGREVSAIAITQTIEIPRNIQQKYHLADGMDAEITCKVSDVYTNFDSNIFALSAYVQAGAVVTFSCNVSMDVLGAMGVAPSIELAKVPLLWGIGYFKVTLDMALKGNVTLNMVEYVCVGVQYTPKDGFRTIKDFHKESFTISAHAEASIGFTALVGFDISLMKGQAYAKAGAKAVVDAQTYDDGQLPASCAHINAWLYITIGGNASLASYLGGKSWSGEEKIYDQTNSPLRVSFHIEDGEPVSRCTREGSDGAGGAGSSSNVNKNTSTGRWKYYTPANSRYGYSGASSGVDSEGKPYTIFEYSLESGNATITKYQGNVSALNIPETLDGYTVTGIGSGVFRNNKQLRVVVIPDSVTSIGSYAFADCSSLSSVKLSKNLKTLGDVVFEECDAIVSIEIPKSLNSGGGTTSGGAFSGCDGLKNVTFEQGTTHIAKYLFYECTGLERIEIPDTVTTIDQYAFADCKNLKEVKIPDSVTEISYDAFYRCAALEEIVLPDSVDSMDTYIFAGCTKLEKAVLPKGRVNIPDGTFQNCTKLTDIELPDSVEAIRRYAFQNSGLTQITLPASVTTIEDSAFQNCAGLKTVTIAEGSKIQKIGSQSFRGCKVLEGIALPDSVTSLGTYAFAECDGLADVTLGTGITAIPSYAFNLCASLGKIVIPYRVTTIKANAFTNCTKLTEVSIPRATVNIDSGVFSYPDKMTIYGVSGTYAEEYAGIIGAAFVGREIPATAMELNTGELKLIKGSSASLILKVTPLDFTDTITWRSSNTSVATVTDGTVKAVSVGTAQITVLAGDTGAVRAVCEVEVVQPVTSIRLNKTSLTMEGGDSFTLEASVMPDNAYDKRVEWSSSDESVASVTQDGVVTALKKGTTTITVKALDGSNVSGTCRVTVNSTAHIARTIADLQSDHPYANNTNDIWVYSLKGASSIGVAFSADTQVDQDYDFIYLYDAAGKETGKYTGSELAGRTVVLDGDTVKIRLVSDEAITAYGFRVTAVTMDGQEIVQTPQANVPSGETARGTKVELTTDTRGASIYYTLDGSEPDRNSILYKTAIVIQEDTVLKAFAVKEGCIDSETAVFTYTVPMLTVTFDSDGGSPVDPVRVAKGGFVKEPEAPVKENYRFAGWYLGDTRFDFRTPVTEDLALKAKWTEYDVLEMPDASLPSGMLLEKGTKIRLTHPEPGVTIYYTLDGMEPTASSAIYRGGITVDQEMTVKAMAAKKGYKNSAVAVFHYTVAEKGSLWGDVLPEDIPAEGIPEGMWIAGVQDAVYTGKAIKPQIRVYDNRTLLTEKKDYTVSYKNNTNAAMENADKAPSVIVTGKGNYTDKQVVTFNILPVDISGRNEAVIADDLTAAYNGKVQKPAPVVLLNGKKLNGNKNYTVQYPSDGPDAYKEPGEYRILISGTGNYSGERSISFTVTKETPVSRLKVSAVKTQTYTGEEIKPALTVKNGRQALTEGVDYLLRYEDNREIGTAYAVLEGIGDYRGIRRISFRIAGQAISKAKVDGMTPLIYNGDEQFQSPSLTMRTRDGEVSLREGTDYVVSFTNNVKAGNATVIFTGINGYSGALKKTFKINAYDIGADSSGKLDIACEKNAAYAKGGAKPEVTVTFDGAVLREGTDYTLKYSNNKKIAGAGEAKAPTVTVKGKGNFKGSVQLNFGIVKQDIGRLTLSAADKIYQAKANIYNTGITITDTDGKKLTAKKDYDAAAIFTYGQRTTVTDASGAAHVREAGETVDAADIIPADTMINVSVRAAAEGNYMGEITGSYRFASLDISKAKVVVAPQSYTGNAVEPGKDQITVTLGGKTLSAGDYEIEGYSNNVKKGKASITIRGIGNYGGAKTVKYNITGKKIGFLWW